MCRLPGPEDISTSAFKTFASELVPFLGGLFCPSSYLSSYRISWKHNEISPILKQDHPSDQNSCRPISLISVTSNLFETIISDQSFRFSNAKDWWMASNMDSGNVVPPVIYCVLYLTPCWPRSMNTGKHVFAPYFHSLQSSFARRLTNESGRFRTSSTSRRVFSLSEPYLSLPMRLYLSRPSWILVFP